MAPESRTVRLLVESQLYPNLPNMGVLGVKLGASVTCDAIDAAIRRVVSESPSLRSFYRLSRGRALVVEDPRWSDDLRIEHADYASLSGGGVEALDAWAAQTAPSEWDLGRQLPIGVSISRVEDGGFYVGIWVHHVAFDGLSKKNFAMRLQQALGGKSATDRACRSHVHVPAKRRRLVDQVPDDRSRWSWDTLAQSPRVLVPKALARSIYGARDQTGSTRTAVILAALCRSRGGDSREFHVLVSERTAGQAHVIGNYVGSRTIQCPPVNVFMESVLAIQGELVRPARAVPASGVAVSILPHLEVGMNLVDPVERWDLLGPSSNVSFDAVWQIRLSPGGGVVQLSSHCLTSDACEESVLELLRALEIGLGSGLGGGPGE